MTELEIKSLSSPSSDVRVDYMGPLDSIYHSLSIVIGVRGDVSSDVFYATVATTEALLARSSELTPLICKRSTLVFYRPTWEIVTDEIESIVTSCNAPTWVEAVYKLQRYFSWEYEDYVRPS